MLCPKCGFYSDAEENVCPECGTVLSAAAGRKMTGAQAIRQGRRARQAALTPPPPRTENNATAPAPGQEGRRRRRDASRSASTAENRESAGQREREASPESIPAMGTGAAGQRQHEADPETGAAETEAETEPDRFSRLYRPVYDENNLQEEEAERAAIRYERTRHRSLKQINWIRITFIVAAVVILAVGGGGLFLRYTDAGQKILARLGRTANSTALWAVGEEQLEEGDVGRAIENLEKARDQDLAEGIVDVDGLLLLGSAYEADGRIAEAAALYEQIYTETPSRTEAYVNHIRILRASGSSGDLARAGELMKTAYEKTGDASFATQRSDLLPAPPEVEPIAGYYETKKRISLSSYQGYDVYYTFDADAELPSGGVLYQEEIFLDEGIHNLRAVAVNGELVSDELRGTYKIIMPSPQTPQSTLAPNTYKTRQRVRLRPGKDNEKDSDIVIYYTVDGSSPDADSPIFKGDPIILPTGWVTLKAVAVNRYNKVSNMLEIKYKIEAKPWPLSAWDKTEPVTGLALYQTGLLDFQKDYGEGTLAEEYASAEFGSECRRYEYSWGYAVMNRTKGGWVLVELYMTQTGAFKLPRGTNVGDTEAYVTGKFRDMGQVESASGNRGLYDVGDGTGKIWLQEDGTKIIRYRCTTADSRWQQLDYYINRSGTVYAVDWKYEP